MTTLIAAIVLLVLVLNVVAEQEIPNVPEDNLAGRKFPKFPTEGEYCDYEFKDNLCCSVTTYETPFKWSGDETHTPTWVKQTKFFEKRVPHTKCKSEGAQCFGKLKWSLDPNIRAECRTDYGIMRVLAYDDSSKEMSPVEKRIPVSCSCHLVRY